MDDILFQEELQALHLFFSQSLCWHFYFKSMKENWINRHDNTVPHVINEIKNIEFLFGKREYSDVSDTNRNMNWAYGVITAIWRI